MNPVHSSFDAPFCDGAGHFQAIVSSPKIFRHFYFQWGPKTSQRGKRTGVVERLRLHERTVLRRQSFERFPYTTAEPTLADCFTSSSDRTAPSTGRHRKTRAPTARGALSSSSAKCFAVRDD